MLKARTTLLVIVIFYFGNFDCSGQNNFPEPSLAGIEFNGRIGLTTPGVAEIYWPGSSVKIKFHGTSMNAVMKDQRGHNYFNVIIDDDSIYRLRIDSAKLEYNLISGLPDGDHTVELFRRTDWNDGITKFYGFSYDPSVRIVALPGRKRMIEFYGNSITVGAANEDYAGDSGSDTRTNNYMSYGAITARHYDARFSCIARSGIGLMVSWFSMIMPEMYNRHNPFDPKSIWDFSKATPDIVVVNLMQNDCALSGMPDYDQFKNRFGKTPPAEDSIVASYSKFIRTIRGHYPRAYIICVLGSMDAVKPGSPWPGYIVKAVASLKDPRVYTHFFPFNNTGEHPKVEEHKQLAESLIGFIDQHVRW